MADVRIDQRADQTLKQAQRLMMLPQMQQAIQMLQAPVMELSQMIELEIQQNPILDYAEPDPSADEDWERDTSDDHVSEVSFDEDDFAILQHLDEDYRDHFAQNADFTERHSMEEDKRCNYAESLIPSTPKLYEYLMIQSYETFETPEQLRLANVLCGSLDDTGLLTTPMAEIAALNGTSLESLEEVLRTIQSFEPPGVGARDLREAFLIQLERQGKSATRAYQIVQNYFEDLLHKRIVNIARGLHCSTGEISQAIESDIATLDLHPGTDFSQALPQAIVPDAVVKQEGEQLIVEVNEDPIVPLKVNSGYLRMLNDDALPEETRNFIRNKLASVKWLQRSVQQRNETIQRVITSITRRQAEFFLNPEGQLVPLTMKILADELEVHESTIARTVANKYIDSPRGLLPLRSFFTNAYTNEQGKELSSSTVREVLQQIIAGEDKMRPLSDEAISNLISKKGIQCARRTVAKYRVELNIGNAQQRREYS